MYAFGGATEDNLNNYCSIDVDGESLPVINGYVIDPFTNSKTKIEFFYLSECDRMVHIDFEDALDELKYSVNHHKCKKGKDKIIQNATSENQFEYVCQKLEHIYKKIDDLVQESKEKHQQQRLNDQRNATTVVVDVHAEDTSTNITSDSEVNQPTKKNNETNSTLYENNTIRELKEQQSPVRELSHSEMSFCIPASDLKVISRWASRNTSFLPYKGMLEVPKETVEADDQYLIALLYTLNPMVVLEQLFSLDSQRSKFTSVQVETSCELSQEEFVKYLGLTQRNACEGTLQNPSHSKKLRSQSNLARQNDKQSNTPTPTAHSHIKNTKSETKVPSCSNNSMKKASSPLNNVQLAKVDTLKPRKSLLREAKENSNLKMLKIKSQYSIGEDKVILDWVLKKKNFCKVNGNTIWQDLQNMDLASIKGRTWQSLRNRFLKNILSQLNEYGLVKDDLHKIIRGAQKGTIQRKDKLTFPTKPNYGLIVKKDVTNKKDLPITTNEKNSGKPELRSAKRKRDDVENHSIYSDIDELSDEVLDVSYSRYKLGKSAEKKRLVENSISKTRSKGRKLFTQHSFKSSMVESLKS